MRAPRLGLLLVAAAACAWGQGVSAPRLVERVLKAQETPGFRTRARLVRTLPGAKDPEVTQLLIKGRREGGATWTLYQALWPEARRGRALVLKRAADGAVSGFLFEPPATELPLTAERLREPLFGSDLTAEDLAEEFWRWPTQRVVGEEAVDGRPCAIVESLPGPGAGVRRSRVKSWIAIEIALPLRVETYGPDGALEKRFEAERVRRRPDGTYTAASIAVAPAAGKTRTVLEGLRSDRGIEVPAEQFSAAALGKALPKATDQGP